MSIVPTTRTIKTKMKNPPLDPNRGTSVEDQARKLVIQQNQLVRSAGQHVLRKGAPDLKPTGLDETYTILEFITGNADSIFFDGFMATPIDSRPSWGTCKSVAELEYHLEEVFKATNEQLDWNIPEGTPYPHNLSKPLPLIPNARGRDFKRLRRQDIEDMLFLLVQSKLTNLSLDDRYALNVALRMYTRRIVIQERVEDLQLAVESYQKKINLTRPDTTRPDLRKMTPYTDYPAVQGIIYQDELNRNRLMRTDKLHKFSDATFNHVRITLNDIATGIQMDYFPKRRWSPQDKESSGDDKCH
ncbi:hypothetical protein Tco_1070193 [Tanacetum coccineum]|uniref:Uncharacterized protein n=1 Tax=Tanacetum coccineum TaxID=301880 RepID=A0ABQ5HKR7_9ASTR